MAGKRLSNYLVDTNVVVFAQKLGRGVHEALGIPSFCRLFYSVQTRKEIYDKQGMLPKERREYDNLLASMEEIWLDARIAAAAGTLMNKYARRGLRDNRDAVIAATALVMNLPLVTYNIRHFGFIEEIRVVHPLDLTREEA